MSIFPRIVMGRVYVPHTVSPAKEKYQPEKTKSYEARINKVYFTSQDMTCSGLLFVPDGFDAAKKYPTVVLSSMITQTNELMGSRYVKTMTKRGYLFFTFDPIGLEDAQETLRDAVSFLGTLDFVDTVHVDHTAGTWSDLRP